MQTLQDSVRKLRNRNVVKGIVRKTSTPRITDIPTNTPLNILPEALPKELNHLPSQSQSQLPTSQPSTSNTKDIPYCRYRESLESFSKSLSKLRFSQTLSSIEISDDEDQKFFEADEEVNKAPGNKQEERADSEQEQQEKKETSEEESQEETENEDESDKDVDMPFNPKTVREEIPPENGLDERSVRRFVEIVDAIYNEVMEEDTDNGEQLLRIIKSRLQGEAYEIAKSSEQTWEHIKEALLSNLTSPSDLQTLLTRFSTCRQRQDETISQFAQRIRALGLDLKEAEQTMVANGQKGLLSDDKVYHTCFINGLLNQNIRTICQSKAKNFKEAFGVARQEEARLNNLIQQAMQREESGKVVSAIARTLTAENEPERQPQKKREVFFKEPELSDYRSPDRVDQYRRGRDYREYSRGRDYTPDRGYSGESRGRSPERRQVYDDRQRGYSPQRPRDRPDQWQRHRTNSQSPSRYDYRNSVPFRSEYRTDDRDSYSRDRYRGPGRDYRTDVQNSYNRDRYQSPGRYNGNYHRQSNNRNFPRWNSGARPNDPRRRDGYQRSYSNNNRSQSRENGNGGNVKAVTYENNMAKVENLIKKMAVEVSTLTNDVQSIKNGNGLTDESQALFQ
jgi:hypothetical protein